MRNSLKVLIVLAAFLAAIIGYSYAISANGPVEPLGRDAFVKFLNPDFYPGHPHSKVLVNYAEERGSPCALVLHFSGSSNYKSYQDGDVYIIEMAFISSEGATTEINWGQALQYFLFGVPDGTWKFKIDGQIYDNYDDAMAAVRTEAIEHGQTGPIPMVWHGSARDGNPVINPGCGFPLYYYICWKQYGRFAAYYFTVKGLLFPYFNSPFAKYELANYQQLQEAYLNGTLAYTTLIQQERNAINQSIKNPSLFPSVYQEILSQPESPQAAVD